MQEISIEGHEILEWLQQRNKIKPDWPHKLKVIRLKLNEVVQLLQTAHLPEIKDVLSKDKRDKDTPLNYSELIEINESLLKSKESESRTLFGGFASTYIKNVQALIKLFQKDNMHVISLANEMSQIISFDLIAAKKNIKAYENQIIDLNIKITMFQTSIKNSRHEIVKLAKRYASNFEINEQTAECLDFNDLINKYVNQFTQKSLSVISALQNIDFPKITDHYSRFCRTNALRTLPQNHFEVLLWLKNKGDGLVSDFNKKVTSNNLTPEELYHGILEQKGFGQPGSQIQRSVGFLNRHRRPTMGYRGCQCRLQCASNVKYRPTLAF